MLSKYGYVTCPNRAAHNNERRSLESLCSRFHKGYSKKSPYDFLWLHALALEGISGYFVSGVGLSTLVLEPGLQRREAVFVWSQREATRKQTILGLTREAPRKPNQFGGILNHLLECLTSLKIKHKPVIRFSEGQGNNLYEPLLVVSFQGIPTGSFPPPPVDSPENQVWRRIQQSPRAEGPISFGALRRATRLTAFQRT